MISRILLFLFLTSHVAFSIGQETFVSVIEEDERNSIKDYLRERYWNNLQNHYHTAIPEEFQQASSVFLHKEILKEYFRNSKNFLRNINVEHNIIKILSKKGLEDHQVFTFNDIITDQSINYNALKIIKPDGRQLEINIDSFAVLKQEGRLNLKSLVIPNLEVGDIIDYFNYLEFRVLFPQQYSRTYDPAYILPQEKYPILDYNLIFTLDPSAFINVSEYKIPEFKKTIFKIDKRTFTRFSLSLKNLAPFPKNLPYLYPFQSLPNLKFQVFIGPYLGDSDMKYNLGGSLKMNKTVQLSRLQDYLFSILQVDGDKRFYHQTCRYLKRQNLNYNRRDSILVDKVYQYYRETQEVHSIIAQEAGMPQDEYQFVRDFHYLLKKFKIKHDIVIAFDRHWSNINQFVLTDELGFLIKIKSDPSIYLANPENLTNINEIPYYYQGTQALLFNPESKKLTREVLPADLSGSNLTSMEIDLKWIDSENIEVNRRINVSGQSKKDWQSIFGMDLSIDQEEEQYVKRCIAQSILKKRQIEEWEETYYPLAEIYYTKAKDAFLMELQQTNSEVVPETYSFEVKSSGNSSNIPCLEIADKFTLQAFTKTAGLNLLFPVGKLLPTYSEISSSRVFDFNFNFPFTYNYTISLHLPNTFTVLETEDFSVNIQNKVGNLKSFAWLDEKQLRINVNYEIKSNFEPLSNLNLVKELFDGLETLHNKSILLVKE